MRKILECTICNCCVPENKTRDHFNNFHRRLPRSAMRFTKPECAKFFIECLVCHKIIHTTFSLRTKHQQIYHKNLPASELFDNKNAFIERAVKCSKCKKFIPIRLFDTHLKEKHPEEKVETSNGNTERIEPTESGELKLTETKDDDAESEEQIFVRCDYCGRELPPNFIDDHILQEHVTDIEDNDDDDNDDSVSLSSHNNGKNRVIDQNLETNPFMNDSKASIMTRINCEHCSKKIRLDKIEKHIQRKHSKQTETKKKSKRKISEIDSVEMVPAKKSRRVSETVNSNGGDEHKSQEEDEEEFYTIYVSRNELEKFLLAKRVYPKNGMFHLKDCQNGK